MGLLEIQEQTADDGFRRLTLLGELDLHTAPILGQRLNELGESAQSVRLDLSHLDFADSTGMALLVAAVEDATKHGWRLEVDPQLSPYVARTVELWGAAGHFWPEDHAQLSPSG